MANTGVALGTISLDTLAPSNHDAFQVEVDWSIFNLCHCCQPDRWLSRTALYDRYRDWRFTCFSSICCYTLILGAQLWLYWGESDDCKDPFELHISINPWMTWRRGTHKVRLHHSVLLRLQFLLSQVALLRSACQLHHTRLWLPDQKNGQGRWIKRSSVVTRASKYKIQELLIKTLVATLKA